jgi:hypothetical protein
MMEGAVALTRCFVLPTSLANLWSVPRLRGRLSRRDVTKVARQFIAWNSPQKDPSRREQHDRWGGGSIWSGAVNEIAEPCQTAPYGTDPFREYVPGNELPGYYRSVPTGQAVPRFDFSSLFPT